MVFGAVKSKLRQETGDSLGVYSCVGGAQGRLLLMDESCMNSEKNRSLQSSKQGNDVQAPLCFMRERDEPPSGRAEA